MPYSHIVIHTVNADLPSVLKFQEDNRAAYLPISDAFLPPEQALSTAIYSLLRAAVEHEELVLL